jgi:hypothetical protein
MGSASYRRPDGDAEGGKAGECADGGKRPPGTFQSGHSGVEFFDGLVDLVGPLDQEGELAVDARQPDFEGTPEFCEFQGDLSVGHRALS